MRYMVTLGFLLCPTAFCVEIPDNKYEHRFTTFRDVIKSKSFVDKTKVIKDFFNHRIFSITAPRGFGKTINMEMIRLFYEVQVFKNGSKIPIKKTDNYHIFSHRKLVITGKKVFTRKRFGKYPVLQLDFESLSSKSFSDFLGGFRQKIGDFFKGYQYLLENKHLTDRQIEQFNKYLDGVDDTNLTEEELLDALIVLSECLFVHFDKKAIVLIDEFDAPILNAIFKSGKDIKKIITFIKKLISRLLECTDYVELVFLNCCLKLSRVATPNSSSMKHFIFNDNSKFAKNYGISKYDLYVLAGKYRVVHEIDKIRLWYEGHTVRNATRKTFNVFSIVNYLESKRFESDRFETGCLANLDKIITKKGIRNEIQKAIDGHFLTIVDPENASIKDIYTLRDIAAYNGSTELKDGDINLVLRFLIDLGYLTVTERQNNVLITTASNKLARKQLDRHLNPMLYSKQKSKDIQEQINLYLNSLNSLEPNKGSYMRLATSILNLFDGLGMPENKIEFKGPLFAFPKFSTNMFSVVHGDVYVKGGKNDTMGRSLVNYVDLLIVTKNYTGILIKIIYTNDNPQRRHPVAYEPLADMVKYNYSSLFNSEKYINIVRNKFLIGVCVRKRERGTNMPMCRINGLYNSDDMRDHINVTCSKDV